MRKPWFVILVLLAVIPAVLDAQGGGRGRGGGAGKGGGNGGNNNKPAEGTTTKADKPADLAAVSITAKWKDAKTIEITATVKNAGTSPYMGSRSAKLSVTGKDGKPEVVKEESLPGIAAGETHTIKIDLTDKKYVDKDVKWADLKWTLELTGTDPSAANDKKIVTLNPGAPPKG